MLQAKASGELIEKRLVQTQAAFLLVAMRRAALALPQALCDRLAGTADPLEAKALLDAAMRGLLTEVADLPNRIDAAAWERFLAEQTADNGAAAGAEERPAKAQIGGLQAAARKLLRHDARHGLLSRRPLC